MKVGTDGVLLGASVDVSGVATALDVGTGTGLIALMLAQRNPDLHIDAIDIDAQACRQARENIANSPWPDRVRVFENSLQEFAGMGNKYDLIVCNPPFFINSKRSKDEKRRLARHADSLPPSELFEYSAAMLSDNGKMGVIFPFADKDILITSAVDNGLYPSEILYVSHNPGSRLVRVVITFTKNETITKEREIAVETGVRHNYTKEFSELVRDFYLYVD